MLSYFAMMEVSGIRALVRRVRRLGLEEKMPTLSYGLLCAAASRREIRSLAVIKAIWRAVREVKAALRRLVRRAGAEEKVSAIRRILVFWGRSPEDADRIAKSMRAAILAGVIL